MSLFDNAAAVSLDGGATGLLDCAWAESVYEQLRFPLLDLVLVVAGQRHRLELPSHLPLPARCPLPCSNLIFPPGTFACFLVIIAAKLLRRKGDPPILLLRKCTSYLSILIGSADFLTGAVLLA